MQITFEIQLDTQLITIGDINNFESLIGLSLPDDYKQYMLTYNGGDVVELYTAYTSNPEGGSGISDFYPIKYVDNTLEEVNETLNDVIPSGYLIISRTRGKLLSL